MRKIILLFTFLTSLMLFSQKSFAAKNGIVYKVGDSIKLGKPSGDTKYKSIVMKPNILGMVPIDANTTNLPGNLENFKLPIKSIKVYQGKYAVLEVELKNAGKWLVMLDQAIDNGEIYNPNRIISKEEAIKTLEEKKKLLDLGITTQEDYDKLKEELKPIIINK